MSGRIRTLLVVAALGCLAHGCVTYPLLAGATTVAPRSWEIGAGVGFAASDQPAPHPFPAPANFDLVARYGLSDRFDLGLQLMTAGAALDARFQVFRCAPGEWPCLTALIALTPGVRIDGNVLCDGLCFPTPVDALLFSQFRVLVGIRVHWFEVVLGPHGMVELPNTHYWRPDTRIGGDLALVAHLPNGWRVAPEATVLVRPHPDGMGNLLGFATVEGQAGLVVFKGF